MGQKGLRSQSPALSDRVIEATPSIGQEFLHHKQAICRMAFEWRIAQFPEECMVGHQRVHVQTEMMGDA